MMHELLPLEAHVERLIAFCGRRGPLPGWRDRLVLDTSDCRVKYIAGVDHGWMAPPDALKPLTRYAPRFDALVRAGYAWINLCVYGLFRGDLVLAVELPRSTVGAPPGATAVNYSGPPLDRDGKPRWDLDLKLIA